MNRLSKSLCFVLILCMLGSMLPFALADGAEAEAAEEAIVTEDAASVEEAAEEAAVTEDAAPAEEAAETTAELTPKEPAAWTVMIYLCGTDLESVGGMATENLKMIANTVPDEKVNVLIQTGGARSWQAEDAVGIDIAEDRLQRWTWDENGFTLVDEEELASMAKHTTLSNFIQFGGKFFPGSARPLHDKRNRSMQHLGYVGTRIGTGGVRYWIRLLRAPYRCGCQLRSVPRRRNAYNTGNRARRIR